MIEPRLKTARLRRPWHRRPWAILLVAILAPLLLILAVALFTTLSIGLDFGLAAYRTASALSSHVWQLLINRPITIALSIILVGLAFRADLASLLQNLMTRAQSIKVANVLEVLLDTDDDAGALAMPVPAQDLLVRPTPLSETDYVDVIAPARQFDDDQAQLQALVSTIAPGILRYLLAVDGQPNPYIGHTATLASCLGIADRANHHEVAAAYLASLRPLKGRLFDITAVDGGFTLRLRPEAKRAIVSGLGGV